MRATPLSRTVTYKHLSDRQADCAELAAKGLTSKEIARQLNISPSTVDTHISSVLARYNLQRRSDLPLFFQQQNQNCDEASHITAEAYTSRSEIHQTPKSVIKLFRLTSVLQTISNNKIYIIIIILVALACLALNLDIMR